MGRRKGSSGAIMSILYDIKYFVSMNRGTAPLARGRSLRGREKTINHQEHEGTRSNLTFGIFALRPEGVPKKDRKAARPSGRRLKVYESLFARLSAGHS